MCQWSEWHGSAWKVFQPGHHSTLNACCEELSLYGNLCCPLPLLFSHHTLVCDPSVLPHVSTVSRSADIRSAWRTWPCNTWRSGKYPIYCGALKRHAALAICRWPFSMLSLHPLFSQLPTNWERPGAAVRHPIRLWDRHCFIGKPWNCKSLF